MDENNVSKINTTLSKVTEIKSPTCRHNKWIVDETLAEITCGICEQKLNPIWCLIEQARTETRLFWQLQRLQKEVEKTQYKLRCKCRHCGKMTPISR